MLDLEEHEDRRDADVGERPAQPRLRRLLPVADHAAGAGLDVLAPAQDLDDALDEPVVGEGLGQVVVGAEAEALEDVLRRRERRQEDERDEGEPRVGAEAADEGPAVHARHHHIRDHEVRRRVDGVGQRARSVARGRHLVAARDQASDDKFPNDRVIIDYVGKLDGRSPGYDLESGLAALLTQPGYMTEVLPKDADRCAAELTSRGSDLEKIGEALKGRAKG